MAQEAQDMTTEIQVSCRCNKGGNCTCGVNDCWCSGGACKAKTPEENANYAYAVATKGREIANALLREKTRNGACCGGNVASHS
ncbi:hypothetical protein ABW20_dc0104583 [Dactylellina cionopaga]|nr:hypothetical protein ABW20_dc0104583 [Dactylellina cionopaga]